MLKLFVSYRSLDSAKVDDIVARLRTLKDADGTKTYELWQDKHNIPAGKDWWEAIVDAIIDCDIFLFFLSRKVLESIVCRAELSYANCRNRLIIPIVLDGEYSYNAVTDKYEFNVDNLPPELDERRAQYLFNAGATFSHRFQQAVDEFQRDRSRWSDVKCPRPLDPREDAKYKDVASLYSDACERAQRLEFEAARGLFQRLIWRGSQELFYDEALEWMNLIDRYQKLIYVDHPHTKFQFNRLWKEYQELFPKAFIEGLFDPKGFDQHVSLTHPRPTQSDFLTAIRRYTDKDFEMCLIPDESEFFYGDEEPQKMLRLPSFSMAKYPITYSQFQKFYDSDFNNAMWWEGWGTVYKRNQHSAQARCTIANHPRDNLSWYDAMAFCRWLSYQINRIYELDRIAEWAVRLPTEYEWEKAARGRQGFLYPYGDRFDPTKSNTQEARTGGTTPVTQYAEGQSDYGVMDLSGNVWEWCLSAHQTPQLLPGNEKFTNGSERVLRGGSWANPGYDSRAVYRHASSPRLRSENYGFRVVSDFTITASVMSSSS